MPVTGPLGAQFLVWEYATAIAGLLLGIDPFDQPNVAESKENTGALLDMADAAGRHADPGRRPGRGVRRAAGLEAPRTCPTCSPALLDAIPEDGYLRHGLPRPVGGVRRALPEGASFEEMTDAWIAADPATLRALRPATDRPVTFGWGPRFLHSTGQYHKGGPQNGVFLQITGAVEDDIEVPGKPYTLGRLQLAQALGDLGALAKRGRPAVRLHLTDRVAGVERLLAAARQAE